MTNRFSKLGIYVTKRRESLGFTQRTFSEMAGISVPYIIKIERGSLNVSFFMIHKLAKGLGIHPGDLFDANFGEYLNER